MLASVPLYLRAKAFSHRHNSMLEFVLLRVTDPYPPKRMEALCIGFRSRKANNLVFVNMAVLGNFLFFDTLVSGIILHPGGKRDALVRSLAKEAVIIIASIIYHNGARIKG
ncbi:MAG: hypothetical protein OZ917_07320 [Candidatus Brocadiaceae bacterium]|nr:hypothetical protein [Candidatus Brocadiaceae bacterium]